MHLVITVVLVCGRIGEVIIILAAVVGYSYITPYDEGSAWQHSGVGLHHSGSARGHPHICA